MEAEETAEEFDASRSRWSSLEMLTAAVIDELKVLRWLYISAHSGDKSPGSPPSPVPRPGVAAGAQRRSRLSDQQRRALDPRLRIVREDDTAS